MYDAGKVIVGLGLFVIAFTSPFWFNAAGGAKLEAPDLTPARAMSPDKKCVMETRYMRERHMDLLNTWRNEVVRDDDRFVREDPRSGRSADGFRHWPDGQPMQKSLTNTCLRCHSNYNEFCNRCHGANAVKPFCFNCHLTGTEGGK
jgi:hypothetical protein